MSKLRDIMSLDVKQWLKSKMGDTAFDIAGIVIRGIVFGTVALAALLLVYTRTIF